MGGSGRTERGTESSSGSSSGPPRSHCATNLPFVRRTLNLRDRWTARCMLLLTNSGLGGGGGVGSPPNFLWKNPLTTETGCEFDTPCNNCHSCSPFFSLNCMSRLQATLRKVGGFNDVSSAKVQQGALHLAAVKWTLPGSSSVLETLWDSSLYCCVDTDTENLCTYQCDAIWSIQNST